MLYSLYATKNQLYRSHLVGIVAPIIIMWFWIIVIAVIIGAIIGTCCSGKDENGALNGAMAGGCLAVSYLGRLFVFGACPFILIWLFQVIFL